MVQYCPWLDPIVQILFVLVSKSLNVTFFVFLFFYVLKTCMKSQDCVFLHQNYIPGATGERPWNKSWIVSSRDIWVKLVQKWLPDIQTFVGFESKSLHPAVDLLKTCIRIAKFGISPPELYSWTWQKTWKQHLSSKRLNVYLEVIQLWLKICQKTI